MPQWNDDEAPGASLGRGDVWLAARHDFRAWSQSLLGLTQAIGSANGAQERAELQSLLRGSVASLMGMMDLLSELALVEAGREKPAGLATDLRSQCQIVIDEHSQLARKHGCRMVPVGSMEEADTCNVDCEPRLLRVLLTGMLLTAIKLRTQGDIEFEITPAGSGGRAVRLNYQGIDPAPGLSRAAFVELAAVDTAPDRPFVGLGLSLGARLARGIGGGLLAGAGPRQWRIELQLPETSSG